MSLNRMFDLIEETRAAASWRSAFGEPQQVGDKTIIQVAQVWYGFGLGFGQAGGHPPADGEPVPPQPGEGGGGGGGASSRPLGALVVTPERVAFEPVSDASRITLAGIAVGALFIWQAARTLRAILARR